jgi:hypothetical protein
MKMHAVVEACIGVSRFPQEHAPYVGRPMIELIHDGLAQFKHKTVVGTPIQLQT